MTRIECPWCKGEKSYWQAFGPDQDIEKVGCSECEDQDGRSTGILEVCDDCWDTGVYEVQTDVDSYAKRNCSCGAGRLSRFNSEDLTEVGHGK